MGNRDMLIGGLDILLSLVVVFALGFFAIRFDQSTGPEATFVSVESLDISTDADFASMHYLALLVWENQVQLREYRLGHWLNPGPLIPWDWSEYLEHQLADNELPLVIYEQEPSSKLGDLVREMIRARQPVAFATATTSAGDQ